MLIKVLFLSIFILICNTCIKAQSNFYQFSIGAGYGRTLGFTDVPKQRFASAGYVSLNYNIGRFISAGLEYQNGQLAGGDVETDLYHRQFINNYQSLSANGNIKLGQFFNKQHLRNKILDQIKGIYVGAGFGFIKNKVNNVRLNDPVYNGPNDGVEMVFPVNMGINFYFKDSWQYTRYAINLNAQANIGMADGTDGYATGNANDNYLFFSVGLRYHFKKFGLDRKR